MNDMIFKKIGYLVLTLLAAGLIAGCSGTTYSSYDENQQYYDQYMDMPGYYDFPRPRVFLPQEEYFTAPEEEEVVEAEGSDY